MSFIRLPDLHPGRCQNVRHVQHADGHAGTVRCLDYEGTEHVCTFPAPLHVVTPSGSSLTYTTPTPQKWVKPAVSRHDTKKEQHGA